MTERRETGRKTLSVANAQNDIQEQDWSKGERIAKWLAAAGVCSRREAERLIEDGQVSVEGQVLDSPAFKVTGREVISVKGQIIGGPEKTRLWRYHKPKGLITTNTDPEGRETIFEHLPKELPRVMTIGRLDLNTEGLLLLTNDGELARALELPSTGLKRCYRARAYGKITQKELDRLLDGVTFEGVTYKSIVATLDKTTGDNNWIDMTLIEGKKREARRALESVGLVVNRLIRVSYGPFELGNLIEGAVDEIPAGELLAEFGESISRKRRPNPSRIPQAYAPPEKKRGGASKSAGNRQDKTEKIRKHTGYDSSHRKQIEAEKSGEVPKGKRSQGSAKPSGRSFNKGKQQTSMKPPVRSGGRPGSRHRTGTGSRSKPAGPRGRK